MKFDRNKAFPYPVLRPYSDDFIEKDFQTNISVDAEADSVIISAEFVLSSKTIQELIDKGLATYAVVVACRDAYFSKTEETASKSISLEFEQGLFCNEVSVNTYIRIKDTVDLTSPEIHSDFGPGPFSYTSGDVIAQDEPVLFYFGREFFKPVTSICVLVKSDGLKHGEWSINTDSHNIEISVSPEAKESIDRARSSRKNQIVLLNSLYLMAITQAVEFLKDDDGYFNEFKWAQVIKKKMNDCGISFDEAATKIARTILEEPLTLLCKSVFSEGD